MEKMSTFTENSANEWRISAEERELNQVKKKQQKEQGDLIAREKKESNNLWIEIRVNNLIDKEFNKFKADLTLDTRPDYDLREQRSLDILKTKDWKLTVKSYGQSCEVDLKTGEVSYIKWWKRLLLWETAPFLTISPNDFSLKSSDLYKVFWQMNVINRAMCMAEKRTYNRQEFYFEGRLTSMLDHTKGSGNFKKGGTLMIDERSVITFEWIKKRFGEDVDKEVFLKMLNKMLLESK